MRLLGIGIIFWILLQVVQLCLIAYSGNHCNQEMWTVPNACLPRWSNKIAVCVGQLDTIWLNHCVRETLDCANWGEKTHSSWRLYHLTDWGPGLHIKKVTWAPEVIFVCFLAADAAWPGASHSCPMPFLLWQVLPSECEPKSASPFLSCFHKVFHHSNKKHN